MKIWRIKYCSFNEIEAFVVKRWLNERRRGWIIAVEGIDCNSSVESSSKQSTNKGSAKSIKRVGLFILQRVVRIACSNDFVKVEPIEQFWKEWNKKVENSCTFKIYDDKEEIKKVYNWLCS